LREDQLLPSTREVELRQQTEALGAQAKKYKQDITKLVNLVKQNQLVIAQQAAALNKLTQKLKGKENKIKEQELKQQIIQGVVDGYRHDIEATA